MPFVLALFGLLALAAASSGSKPRRGGPVPLGPVEQWADEHGLILYLVEPGWESQTDCLQNLITIMPGGGRHSVPIDVIVDTKGQFWRPNTAPGACPQKCIEAPDLERDFRAWLQTTGQP